MVKTITGVPKELVKPLGNLIQKVAYTQLGDLRLVGIGIESSDGRMAMQTTKIEGTVSMLDVITSLSLGCVKKEALLGLERGYGSVDDLLEGIKGSPNGKVFTTTFSNLYETLDKYVDMKNTPKDLLVINDNKTLKMQFMWVTQDMNSRCLQAFMSDGLIPIPVIILDKFVFDSSKEEDGVLTYTIDDSFDQSLTEQLQLLFNKFN